MNFSYFFLLFPPAAAPAPATLLKPIEKNDCSYFFLLFPAAAPAAAPAPATPVAGCDAKIEPLPAANHHGSEGRKSIKIAPKNCLM